MRTIYPVIALVLVLTCPTAPLQAAGWPDLSRMAIHLDNDEFTGNRPDDRWYSSGGRIDWRPRASTPPGFAAVRCLNPITSTQQKFRHNFYSFGQDIYSQNNRLNAVADPDDRPVGAFLYLQAGHSTLSPVIDGQSNQTNLKWEVGVTGPAALGESVQNGIHQILGVDEVTIWDKQIRPRLGVNLHFHCVTQLASTAAEYRQPLVLNAGYDISVGNVLTQAGVSLAVAGGPDARAMAIPRTARQASPIVRKVRRWGVIAGVSARAVAYDAMIDGKTYGYESRVNSKLLQGEVYVGLSVALGSRWQLSYALSRRSMDFESSAANAPAYKLQTVGQIVLQAPL